MEGCGPGHGLPIVTLTLHRLRDGSLVFEEPKSNYGRRSIALSPSAVRMLSEHKVKQEGERLLLGGSLTENDLVFSHPDGNLINPETLSQAWRRFARRSGFQGVRLHDARHTHASLLLKAGIHPKVVQERLGHASISTTLDLYSHVTPGLQEAAAQRFDESLNEHKPTTAEIEPEKIKT